MPKFKYRIIQADALDSERLSQLNHMGEEGWELVSYTTPIESPRQPGYWFVDMVFKREKK